MAVREAIREPTLSKPRSSFISSMRRRSTQVEENASQYDQAGFLFVVYDVTKEDSFASCAKWIQGGPEGAGGQVTRSVSCQ